MDYEKSDEGSNMPSEHLNSAESYLEFKCNGYKVSGLHLVEIG